MPVLLATQLAIKKAVAILKKGGIVAFPTETVYGLGADAFNPMAVAKIFEVKSRPQFDPLIVHIGDKNDIYKLCRKVNSKARLLIDRFWPGPLTLVLPKEKIIPNIVTAGLPTVAVRMPSHPVALSLINQLKKPIAAASANLFGRLSPTTAEHVKDQLGDKVDLILDGGKTERGIESTVITFIKNDTILLRPGAIPVESLEAIIGKIKLAVKPTRKPLSPGQLAQHYSPHTRLIILNPRTKIKKNKRCGLLAFTRKKNTSNFAMVEVLSEKGDLREAASNLFSCLHRLDKAGLDIIYAEPVPKINLGYAIMDRLKRAAHKNH